MSAHIWRPVARVDTSHVAPVACLYDPCRHIREDLPRPGRRSSRRQASGAGLPCSRTRKGWDVEHVYVDDDISAYSGKHRPAYEALVAALRGGELGRRWSPTPTPGYTALYASLRTSSTSWKLGAQPWPSSRWRLRPHVGCWSDDGPHPGCSRPWRERADLRAHQAQVPEKREKGEWTGGGSRPYGYGLDRVTVVESEAEIIREAARRVLAGESAFGVANDLNRRGVPSSTGTRWTSIRLKKMLASARIAGRVHYGGEDVGEVVWPPIITMGEHTRLKAMITYGHPPSRQRHLLSGVLRCTCGHAMVSGGSSGGHQPIYACRRDMGGCGTTIRMKPVEALVVKALMPRLDAAPLMHRSEPEDPDVARIEEARANIVAIGEQKLSPASLPVMLAPWERQIPLTPRSGWQPKGHPSTVRPWPPSPRGGNPMTRPAG